MNKAVLAILAVLVIATGSIDAQVSCFGKTDGSYGWGCRSYTECVNGVGTTVYCNSAQAYDYRTGKCGNINTVPLPCGSWGNDCATRGTGVYPYKCTWFYTCLGKVYLGANPCNNPPNGNTLVYDSTIGVCNWRWAVDPPCGTKV